MKTIHKVLCVAGATLAAVATGTDSAQAGASNYWPVEFSTDSQHASWYSGSISDTRATPDTGSYQLCWYLAHQNWLECRAQRILPGGGAQRNQCGTNRLTADVFSAINTSSKVTFRCGPGGVLDVFEVANGSEFL